MCKGGANATSTVDRRLMGLVGNNYADANAVANRPYQPYSGMLTAPMTPVQNQAGGLLQAAPYMGQGALSAGVNATGQGAQYQAPVIQPASYSATQAQPGQVGAPAQVGQLPMVNAPNGLSQLSGYTNPYTQNVVDTTMADLNRQNAIALNTTNQNATAEGAFGGDRQAVADSLTNDAYARAAANTLAQLNSQGFNTAAGLLQQNQQMGLQAGGQNLNAALAAGQANAGAQNAAAALNAGNQQQAALVNAGALNTAGSFNAGQALQAALANQGAASTAVQLRNSAGYDLGLLGSDQNYNYLNGVNALSAFGGQQQQTQQAALNAAYQQYLNQMNYPVQMQNLRNASLLNMGGTSSPASSGQSTGSMLGGLGSLAGGAAALYGSGLFSSGAGAAALMMA